MRVCVALAGWWRLGCLLAAPGRGCWSDELGQAADVSQRCGEGVLPGPVEREAQSVAAAVVEEACGHCEEPVAHCSGDGELCGGVEVSEAGCPAQEVVGECGAGEPGAVGEEPSRGAAAQAVVFEVFDGELDSGVARGGRRRRIGCRGRLCR